MKKLFYILLILFFASTVFGATHTVNQTGSGADYSVSQFNALSGTGYAGDTFYFSGTITSTVDVNISGTSTSNYVTLDGYQAGDCDPINSECTSSAEFDDSGSTLTSERAFWFTDQDYIIIQDFRSDGGKIHFAAIYDDVNDSHDIIIRRNELHDMATNAIDIDQGHYFTIGGASGQGNEIYDCGDDTGHGDINFLGTDDIIISYNHLYATKANGNSGDRGIDGIVSNGASKRILIEYNSIHSHNDSYGGDAHGEDGMDIKQQAEDMIIRFNNVYDHQQQAGIQLQGGCQNAYVYGNRTWGNAWNGIYIYARNSGYQSTDEIYIWSNLIIGNKKRGIQIYDSGDGVSDVYIYNNTIGRNGIEYTDTYSETHTVDADYGGIYSAAGTVRIKNNIFYDGQPDEDTEYQAYYSTTPNTLEHNTYYSESGTSLAYYSSGWRNVATLQGTYSKEDDATAGEDGDPGFTDANGADNTYDTADDDYTLNGTNVDDGEDLSQCFQLDIQGVQYYFCLDDILNPATTDWTTTPPTVNTVDQDNWGTAWERGAYAYPTSGLTITVSATDATATEASQTTGEWTIACSPNCAGETINYSFSGTATLDTDYDCDDEDGTIDITGASDTITLTPVDDNDYDPGEVAILTIDVGSGYAVGSPDQASISIVDDEAPPAAGNPLGQATFDPDGSGGFVYSTTGTGGYSK